jgi:hypothetical protein
VRARDASTIIEAAELAARAAGGCPAFDQVSQDERKGVGAIFPVAGE